MAVIDLNEIYKIIYYKYILSFKVFDIIGVKHSQSWAKNRGLVRQILDYVTDYLIGSDLIYNYDPLE